jgi:hypothetical protein
MGAAIAWTGTHVHAMLLPWPQVWWCLPAAAFLLALREIGILRFSLPEAQRQANRFVANRIGVVLASGVWGFDIALGFATWVNFGGFWILVIAIVLAADMSYGALLMASYWFGRASSVLVGPLLLFYDGSSKYETAGTLLGDRVAYRRLQAASLLWFCILAVASLYARL